MSTYSCQQWCQPPPKDLPKGHPHAFNNGQTCEVQGQTNYYPVNKPIWNQITRVGEDLCTQAIDEMQSQLPGYYYTNNFFRWCESQEQYANLMAEPAQFYKPYRNACRVDTDSVLRYADLTNKGEIYQLFTKPYATVPYMGAGQRSLSNKELESQLQQGHTATIYKPCEPTSGVTYNRFQCLPDFGNPQMNDPVTGLSRVIEPWVRGGEVTRDYVRRVNYEKHCLNRLNNNEINRTN